MKILAQSTDGVDILVGPILGECPNAAARKLEELDAKLFCGLANETWSGKRRFVMVKTDWRTILTLAGAVTFRRRYYLDRSTGRYTHPLDAAMGLCRYSRASADVRLKILDMAGECPYRYVGANAVPGQVLSKSTVCRIIRDTAVTSAKGKMDPGKSAVHVQIDEKYISMIGKKHKSRYITATIYAGKKTASGRNALTNRTLIPGVENGVVTLEHDTIKHEVKVNCLKAFAKKIVLTLYADSNPNVKGTMTFDFRERINVILPDSINLVEGQVPTVNPRVDSTGGTITVDKNVTDVTYSWNPDFLAWVKEKSLKELNDYMTENQANMSFQVKCSRDSSAWERRMPPASSRKPSRQTSSSPPKAANTPGRKPIPTMTARIHGANAAPLGISAPQPRPTSPRSSTGRNLYSTGPAR